MRIGIDIDDTICDTWEYSLPFFSKYFEINLDELKELEIDMIYLDFRTKLICVF